MGIRGLTKKYLIETNLICRTASSLIIPRGALRKRSQVGKHSKITTSPKVFENPSRGGWVPEPGCGCQVVLKY